MFRRLLFWCFWISTQLIQLTAASAQQVPIADRFIFPVRGVGVQDIQDNTADPRTLGWSTSKNDYAAKSPGVYTSAAPFHPGEDWNLTCASGGYCDEGEPVFAVANGRVTQMFERILYEVDGVTYNLKSGVMIEHTLPQAEDLQPYLLQGTRNQPLVQNKVWSGYLHMKEVTVRVGDIVQIGQQIGKITDSGTGPHLHLEMHWIRRARFPEYKASWQQLTDAGLMIPSAFLRAHTGVNQQNPPPSPPPAPPPPPPQPQPQPQQPYHISSELGPNPQVCNTQPTGGADTNWVYTCDAQQNFQPRSPIWTKFYIMQVRGNHTFAVKVYRDNTWVVTQTYSNNNVGNNVWNSAFYMPQLNNVDAPGNYRLDFFVQMEGSAMPEQPVATTQFVVGAVPQGAPVVPQPAGFFTLDSDQGRNPQTCTNQPTGGPETNWVYSCNVVASFRVGFPVWGNFFIRNVRGNHEFRVQVRRDGTLLMSGRESYANQNVGDAVWNTAYFQHQFLDTNIPGTYTFEYFVRPLGGQYREVPDARVNFTVTALQNNPAPQPQPAPPPQQQPYVYVADNNNPHTCASQPSGSAATNWVYTCERDSTFHVNDTVWGNFYISTVRVNHRFQTQVYRNNVPIRTLGPTNVNPVSGVWDRATYWPDYRPDQPGQYEFKFQVDTGSGFVDVPGAIARFSVAQIVSPPFVIEPSVPTTCRGPINGDARTDWVYTCSNPTNQFRVGETAYALLRIQNVYDSHEFRAQFYRNGVRVGEPQRYTNDVDPAHPWNTAFFWPSYPNVQAGDWAVLITVTPLGGGDPVTARASFTVR